MLADASGIDCAFRLGQNKIFSLSLNQGNLDILLATENKTTAAVTFQRDCIMV
jgi:hypothetical protein